MTVTPWPLPPWKMQFLDTQLATATATTTAITSILSALLAIHIFHDVPL